MVKEEGGEEEENSTVRGGSTREKEPVRSVFYEVYCEEQVTAGMARRVRDPPGRPPGRAALSGNGLQLLLTDVTSSGKPGLLRPFN